MSLDYSTNNRGEILEHCSDGITLNLSYWECGCDSLCNSIHTVDVEECPRCGALKEENANAYAIDVEEMLEELE